jgi:uncharacterized membrane protein
MILVLYLGYLAVAVGYLIEQGTPFKETVRRIMDRYFVTHGKDN